ncbi:pyrroline-5-carboxylate reductase [Aureococcus anophagefferens]|nr:pyrroline-5-carboxylate reductase [Aureococcus anophagefferens]
MYATVALLLASVSALEIVSKTLPLQVGTPIAKPCRIAAPANIAFREDFQAVDAQLDLGKQAIVVENAANAVPTDAWDAVPPTDWKCVLPEARDAEATAERLRAQLLPALRGLADEHQASLVDCIAKLSGELARACDARGVDARLHVTRVEDARASQPCPKFHADTVQARCIATLAGRGTQVLPDDAVDHESESPYTRLLDATAAPYDARAGDAVLLVGRLWRGQRSAAVHRSPPPPCACCDWPSRRVVLVLDPGPKTTATPLIDSVQLAISNGNDRSKHPMSALDGKKIGFVGAGAMATAIMQGLLKRGVDASRLMASDPYAGCRERAAASGIATTESNAAVAAACDVIVVAVKPGVAALEPWDVRVVRTMPNTPCLVGEAAVGVARGARATDANAAAARGLFAGTVVDVPEKLLNAVTAVSGSGPAYVFLFVEALADAGVRAGLPRDVALKLAAQTVKGAAAMQLETGKHPGVLKDQVCSPGGTTIAGVEALEKNGFRFAAMSAVAAANARADDKAGRPGRREGR